MGGSATGIIARHGSNHQPAAAEWAGTAPRGLHRQSDRLLAVFLPQSHRREAHLAVSLAPIHTATQSVRLGDASPQRVARLRAAQRGHRSGLPPLLFQLKGRGLVRWILHFAPLSAGTNRHLRCLGVEPRPPALAAVAPHPIQKSFGLPAVILLLMPLRAEPVSLQPRQERQRLSAPLARAFPRTLRLSRSTASLECLRMLQ